MTDATLLSAYRRARSRFHYGDFGPMPVPAVAALATARESIISGKPLAHYGGTANPYAGRPDSNGLRFIESTERAGLRFVNFADELRSYIRHTGWYQESDCDGEVLRGAVYQLPARGGRPAYVAGYREGSDGRNGWRDMNDDSAVIDFSRVFYGEPREESARDSDAASDAAQAADGMAESAAESAREYNDAWRAGNDFATAGEELEGLREEALALMSDGREALKRAAASVPNDSTDRALLAQLESMLEDMRELRSKRRELASDHRSWQADAFADGAELTAEQLAKFAR